MYLKEIQSNITKGGIVISYKDKLLPQISNKKSSFATIAFLSSPELKAHVSYSDHILSVVRLSVRPSVRLSVCL